MGVEAMTMGRDRVISVTLSEAEWQLFVTRHPQPVSWLQERIKDEVNRLVVEQTLGTGSDKRAEC
jgi:hypothetical protein